MMNISTLISSLASAMFAAGLAYAVAVNVHVSTPPAQNLSSQEITAAILEAESQIKAREDAEIAEQKAASDARFCRFMGREPC